MRGAFGAQTASVLGIEGGRREGINLQVARRLVHIDVPWNPIELEQRVGRVHRFGSRETVVLDTLVMRDSREEAAYAVADQKLRMITKALVPHDRFDALFSRVMTLIPPEEEAFLRHRNGETGVDAEKIGELVQDGFNKWKAFHDKYSSEQKKIQALDPGLAAWEVGVGTAQAHGFGSGGGFHGGGFGDGGFHGGGFGGRGFGGGFGRGFRGGFGRGFCGGGFYGGYGGYYPGYYGHGYSPYCYYCY